METFFHLWCIDSLSQSLFGTLKQKMKNKIIQHYVDTMYCTSKSFDELFMVLFSNAKSRSLLYDRREQMELSPDELNNLAQEILKYSTLKQLEYSTSDLQNGGFINEKVVDFPLKAFSLCPCTRRPLYVALYLNKPNVLRLLLNCSARIPYEDYCSCTVDRIHPLVNVLSIIKRIPVGCVDPEEFYSRKKNCVVALEVLLVDLSYFHALWWNVCDVVDIMKNRKRSRTVPTLKHISRFHIRQILRDKQQMFNERCWKNLELPQNLASYLTIDLF